MLAGTRKPPMIEDKGITVVKKNSILRFLASKYFPNSNWYPSDLVARNRVDSLLDFSLEFDHWVKEIIYWETLHDVQIDGNENVSSEFSVRKHKEHVIEMLTSLERSSILDSSSTWNPSIGEVSLLFSLLRINMIPSILPLLAAYPQIINWSNRLVKLLSPHFFEVCSGYGLSPEEPVLGSKHPIITVDNLLLLEPLNSDCLPKFDPKAFQTKLLACVSEAEKWDIVKVSEGVTVRSSPTGTKKSLKWFYSM
jgi:hypothetical protein